MRCFIGTGKMSRKRKGEERKWNRPWRPGDTVASGCSKRGYNLKAFLQYLDGEYEFDTSTRELIQEVESDG